MQFGWFQGKVRLSVTGLGMERLLAAARERGLTLCDLRRPGRTQLTVTLSRRQGRVLTALAGGLGLTVEVLGSWGLPALWIRLLARPTLAAGLLLCFLLLIPASGRIWEIRIVGAEGARQREVERCLAEQGLYFGARTADQDVNRLEYVLRQEFPQLRFAGIRVAGMRATVELAQGSGPLQPQELPGGSVVASRAGVIERVTPSRGTPRVEPGEVVARGQLLIEGVTELSGQPGEPEPVTAAGEVIARIWVHASASGSLTRVEPDPEGAVAQEWTLILGEARFPLPLGTHSGDMVLESVRAWRLPGFASAAPVALEKRQYRQGTLTRCDYDRLLDSLRSQSGAEALRQLPPDAQVRGREETVTVEQGIITLHTQLEALCDIAGGEGGE